MTFGCHDTAMTLPQADRDAHQKMAGEIRNDDFSVQCTFVSPVTTRYIVSNIFVSPTPRASAVFAVLKGILHRRRYEGYMKEIILCIINVQKILKSVHPSLIKGRKCLSDSKVRNPQTSTVHCARCPARRGKDPWS